jgi:hypothetical protein
MPIFQALLDNCGELIYIVAVVQVCTISESHKKPSLARKLRQGVGK